MDQEVKSKFEFINQKLGPGKAFCEDKIEFKSSQDAVKSQ